MSHKPHSTGLFGYVLLFSILLLMLGVWWINSPGSKSGASDLWFLGLGRGGAQTNGYGVTDRPIGQN